MCVSRYKIKIKPHHHVHECFPMVRSESQKLLHRHMCALPPSLHRLYLPVRLLSANVYVCEITYMHTRTNTRLGDNPRSPNTHKGYVFNIFEQTQRQYETQITEEKSERNRESGGEGGGSSRNRQSCMERATFASGRGVRGG